MRKIIAALMALLVAAVAAACGAQGPEPVNTTTASFDEMVTYLTEKGYIEKDTQPVDMLTTEGYVTDNTGGEYPTAPFADQAEDYDGLWVMWWEPGSEAYESCFANAAMNGNVIVYMGGAATLEPAAINGNFAIAFGPDYGEKDQVLEDFQALPNE
ncbi:MAG: hypothetical protein ACOYJZ_10120 [Acutalibacter sp.]|jgi:hypothetical protein